MQELTSFQLLESGLRCGFSRVLDRGLLVGEPFHLALHFDVVEAVRVTPPDILRVLGAILLLGDIILLCRESHFVSLAESHVFLLGSFRVRAFSTFRLGHHDLVLRHENCVLPTERIRMLQNTRR